jgi:hypothetical protein
LFNKSGTVLIFQAQMCSPRRILMQVLVCVTPTTVIAIFPLFVIFLHFTCYTMYQYSRFPESVNNKRDNYYSYLKRL